MINPKDMLLDLTMKSDEVYALYLTLGDKKGNVIGSYPINSSRVTGINIAESDTNIKDIIVNPNSVTVEFLNILCDYINNYKFILKIIH
jgi:hypothetical protein